MTPDELAAIERRAEAASEGGPWTFHWEEERARFINAAREDVPALLRAVRERDARIAELEAEIGRLHAAEREAADYWRAKSDAIEEAARILDIYEDHEAAAKLRAALETAPASPGEPVAEALASVPDPARAIENARKALIWADSELSAIAHGRPQSPKEELITISDRCRAALAGLGDS